MLECLAREKQRGRLSVARSYASEMGGEKAMGGREQKKHIFLTPKTFWLETKPIL